MSGQPDRPRGRSLGVWSGAPGRACAPLTRQLADKGLGGQGGEERKMIVQDGLYSLSPHACCSDQSPEALPAWGPSL